MSISENVRIQRLLRAQFTVEIGGMFVAIDRSQPVAVFFGQDGSYYGSCSWAELTTAPSSAEWPNRRVARSGDELIVQDLPDGCLLRVSTSSRAATIVRDTSGLEKLKWKYPKILGTPVKESGAWTLGTSRTGNRLTAHIGLGQDSISESGSLVDFAVIDEWAIAVIRRADVRPWLFEPNYSLVSLNSRRGISSVLVLSPVDIAELCWPRGTESSHLLSGYLPFTMGQVECLRQSGARDLSVKIADFDSSPIIETRFRLNEFKNSRFVRRDKPIDELGNLAGLAFWNVTFGEDLPLRDIDGRFSDGWTYI